MLPKIITSSFPSTLPIAILMLENEEDRAFMQTIYEQHKRLIYHTVSLILHTPQDYDDVVNEVCVNLIKKIETLKPFSCCTLRNYIVSTTRNVAINYALRNQRYKGKMVFADDRLDEFPSDEPTAEETMAEKAGRDELKAALHLLPVKEKQLLLMKYVHQMDDEDIAAVMCISKNSVRMYITRAKRLARQKLTMLRQGDAR